MKNNKSPLSTGMLLIFIGIFVTAFLGIFGIILIVIGILNLKKSVTNIANITNMSVNNGASNATTSQEEKIPAKRTDYNSMYELSEKDLTEKFILDNLNKVGIDPKSKLLPNKIVNKKIFLNILFAILLFIYICLVFFHFPIYTYLIGIVVLIFVFVKTRKFDLIKYLTKQLQARPDEKVINIIMGEQATFTNDRSGKILIAAIVGAITLPLIIFYKPLIIYEKTDGGYAVRYYAFGITEFKTASIPATHNGENVVSLRGNTFSNMFFLESVTLPNTITEIRGQAFKNTAIETIELPSELEYLGGGAFYNCKNLKSIILPDTLEYLGGEAFYGASSLSSVKLSKKLSEIRGNTFEKCTSLQSIEIPDSVTRIGAHAFYGDLLLSNVSFTPYSKLNEIGSSAFRNCYNLHEIVLPAGLSNTSINSKAFKGSPTQIKRFENTYFQDSTNYN